MLDECVPHHDWFNAFLTFGLCVGLVISYLPQHYRIISAKSSEGLSPVFLLLGTTSAASGLFNMITLQAPIVKCCRVVSVASCVEMTAGVIQLGIQWVCFGIIFVLYMVYYPPHLKYLQLSLDEEELPPIHVKTHVRSEEWRLSIILAWVTVLHLIFISLTTAYLLAFSPSTLTPTPSPSDAPSPQISLWATFLGVSAALLAAIQYAPQILHTYRTKLVGALSIPMMMIQTPGGILMVTSIVLRPGTNWTSWITFAVAAIMQGCLLAMCIAWKIRQGKLHIDDFGNPVDSSSFLVAPSFTRHGHGHGRIRLYEDDEYHSHPEDEAESDLEDEDEPVPGLITTPSEDPIAIRAALASALESAAESSLLSPTTARTNANVDESHADEQTPLLRRSNTNSRSRSKSRAKAAQEGEDGDGKSWKAWFG